MFSQQLWGEYYRSLRESAKKSKDKHRKKVSTFWKDLPVAKKLEVIGVTRPEVYAQRLRESEVQAETEYRRVTRPMSQHVLTPVGIENYLKHVAGLHCKDFYDRMKMCALADSHTQEAELGWFVVARIKEHLQQRFEESQLQLQTRILSMPFKKGKGRTKKFSKEITENK